MRTELVKVLNELRKLADFFYVHCNAHCACVCSAQNEKEKHNFLHGFYAISAQCPQILQLSFRKPFLHNVKKCHQNDRYYIVSASGLHPPLAETIENLSFW